MTCVCTNAGEESSISEEAREWVSSLSAVEVVDRIRVRGVIGESGTWEGKVGTRMASGGEQREKEAKDELLLRHSGEAESRCPRSASAGSIGGRRQDRGETLPIEADRMEGE